MSSLKIKSGRSIGEQTRTIVIEPPPEFEVALTFSPNQTSNLDVDVDLTNFDAPTVTVENDLGT